MGDAGSLSRRDLEALKEALACILQEENPLPLQEQQAREAELSRRLSPISSDGSPSPAHALHTQDLSIISRLLNQVHHLLAGEDGGEILMRSKDVEKPDSQNLYVATEKNMVEAVVEIASAAAEAAKAAAASTGKNLEVLETLLSNSEKNVRPRPTHSGSHDEDRCNVEALEDEISRQPIIDKDLVKKLERQNRITHWILGLMIVATAIWRFKILSVVLGVKRTFTNPFQAIGDFVSEGIKGGNKEDQNGAKGFHKAKTVLPSLLGGEEKEITKRTEKTEHSTTEDFKIGEALTLSLGNLLPAGKSDGHASRGATEECSPKE